MSTLTLPHNFVPRWYQRPLWRAVVSKGVKRAVSIWHRRAGKDKTLINIMATQAAQRVGSYYYFFPTYKQGRKILWDGMDKNGFPFLGHIPEQYRQSVNGTEMKVKLINGSLIQIVGSDNIDSVVGSNPVGCIFSEYALQDPRGWDFVRPILRENEGWALFNYTPRGKNHGWDLYKMAVDNPDWFCERLTIDDTEALSREDIEDERRAGMSEDLIQQEFFCSFDASQPGAFFGREMRQAREQGRITRVPVESGIPIDTYWDLGINDQTAIWFCQTVGRELRLVRYYENSSEALAHYANEVARWSTARGGVVGDITLPHDGNKRSLQTGKRASDYLRQMGFKVRVAKRPQTKEDGIEASRQILGKCWFDSVECDRGIEGLSQYHKSWDEVNKVYGPPVHDWCSHVADAFQTLALGHRERRGLTGFQPKR